MFDSRIFWCLVELNIFLNLERSIDERNKEVDMALFGVSEYNARPTVSCCSIPTEKLTLIISHIIKHRLGDVSLSST